MASRPSWLGMIEAQLRSVSHNLGFGSVRWPTSPHYFPRCRSRNMLRKGRFALPRREAGCPLAQEEPGVSQETRRASSHRRRRPNLQRFDSSGASGGESSSKSPKASSLIWAGSYCAPGVRPANPQSVARMPRSLRTKVAPVGSCTTVLSLCVNSSRVAVFGFIGQVAALCLSNDGDGFVSLLANCLPATAELAFELPIGVNTRVRNLCFYLGQPHASVASFTNGCVFLQLVVHRYVICRVQKSGCHGFLLPDKLGSPARVPGLSFEYALRTARSVRAIRPSWRTVAA
jgi:hypothetical protein